jgi:aminopeptidase N
LRSSHLHERPAPRGSLRSASQSAAILGLAVATVVGTAGVAAAAQQPPAQQPPAPYDGARSQPVEDPNYPAKGDPSVDALHYGLKLHWAPKHRKLKGKATIVFRATAAESRIQLDLGKPLKVRGVHLDGRTVSFSHPGKNLVVAAGAVLVKDSRHTLTVRYAGRPKHVKAPTDRSDIAHLGWTVTKGGEVWTMQEPFGAYSWYPVNDQPSDKAFYDVRISAPKRWVGIFNGRLEHRRTTAKRTITRWHLASPASSYLTTIAIGDYVRHHDTGPHHLPITYWVPRDDQSTLSELQRTPKMIKWLEKRLGPYPFDRIGAVVVPNFSAMETQTLVTMGGQLLSDYGRRDFRADLLHEYSHQWYGDTVTPNNWPDLWLNESFAMYTQIRWEVARGWETMAQWRRDLKATDNDSRASDGPPGAYHPQQFGDICVYYCGALMLDRLRTKLGVSTFNAIWRGWPQQHRFASVDRSTYIDWANARAGQDLSPFLTAYLTSPTTPPG